MLNNTYPLVNFRFSVKVEGFMKDMSFQEVSGISAEIETETVKEGGVNEYSHKLPKGVKFNNLVLKRGVVEDSPIMKWILNAVEKFTFTPKMTIVSLLDVDNKPLLSWVFYDAYPVAIKLSDLNAQDGKVMIETMELSYSYYKRG